MSFLINVLAVYEKCPANLADYINLFRAGEKRNPIIIRCSIYYYPIICYFRFSRKQLTIGKCKTEVAVKQEARTNARGREK